MDLTNYMLIDLSTGTMLTSKRCVLVHEDALTEAEWDALDGAPDSDIVAIGRERGIPLMPITITNSGDFDLNDDDTE